MTIRSEPPFAARVALGLGPDGKPWLTVLAKAAYTIPTRLDGAVERAAAPPEIAEQDTFHADDPTGSVRLEAEAVVHKPRTDIVLVGHAYAPRGRPAGSVDVALRVGDRTWSMRVVGDRRWVFPTRLVLAPSISEPEPFVAMPLVYERAFGGVDPGNGTHAPRNPIGRGYLATQTQKAIDGTRLPNLEDPRQMIRAPDDTPDPVGWGFFGRAWEPRAGYAGRDVDALHPTFGLPADFDHAYYNGAHPALQIPGYLQGGEPVEFVNVTRDGHRRFRLPAEHPSVALETYTHPAPDAGEPRPTRWRALKPVLDTLILFPDEDLLTLTWRAGQPIEGDLADALPLVHAVEVSSGTPSPDRA